ncbi:MAG: Signal peptidase-like protein [Flavobacteriales bacterium]|nr:Signal peptidase-like protein [Bacteroidota bacterium]MCB9241586.1 Signal peptidase-like protein [Flavobacteriales bacterium]
MGCGKCGSGQDGESCSAGCGNNGSCGTMACNKLNTYDWLNHMVLPDDYKPLDVVEVRFKGSRKEFYRNVENLDLYTGQPVIVQSDFGHDLGHISLSGELVRLQLKKNGLDADDESIRKVYRLATDKDKETYTELKAKEPSTLEKARTIAMEMRLNMKLSDIEFQGDGRKVIFFYTAEERVDFRQLIKRYATEFRTRIEMRQVSYREEASRLGGIGSCGRELCCSTWLTDYKVVTMGSARTQNLSINMLKLSGQCGRLKCCLNYELDTYLEALSEFPKGDRIKLETKLGSAYLQKTDILKRMLWFSYAKSSEWIALDLERVNEIIALNKRGEHPETLVDKPVGAMLMDSFEPAADLISDQSLDRMDDLERARRNKRKNKKRNPKGKGNRPDQRDDSNRNQNRDAKPRSNDQKPKGQSSGNRNRNKRRRPPKKSE